MIAYAENATVTENSQINMSANSLYNNLYVLTNQPYFPQNLVTNIGSTVIWLNADVGHKHMITLSDSNSKKVYETAFFPYNEDSKPLTLNKTGNFSYLEKGANKAVPSFVMNGTITVIASPSELEGPKNASSQKQIGTGGCLYDTSNYVRQIRFFRICKERFYG